MVDFEDVQPDIGVRIAQGERIKPCAKDNRLTHASRDRSGERVFSEAATRSQKKA